MPTRQLAEIFLLQNRLEDAKYLSEIAVDMYEVDCVAADSVGLAQAIHTLAQIQAARSDWGGILSKFEEMRQRLDGEPEAFERLYGSNLEWLLAQAKTGSAAAAIRQLQATVDSLSDRAGEYEHAEYLGALAFAQYIAKDHKTARRNFAMAIPVILEGQTSSGTAVRDKVKSVRQHLILSAYMKTLLHAAEQAASENVANEAKAELFRIANVSHLGRVQRAVTAAAARNAISDPALAELMRREQGALQESETILNMISNLQLARSDQVRKENIVTLQARFSALSRSRRTIMQEISQRFPAYANLINPGPTTLDDAVTALRPGESMIVFHVSETGTLVWAIPESGKAAFAHLPIPERKIAEWVNGLRVALDPDASTLGEIPIFDMALSHQVFRSLLAPVQAGWKNAERILLIPHGALGQLPFGLLVTAPYERPEPADGSVLFSSYKGVPWFIRQASIARYPSVNALLALRNAPAQQQLGSPMAGFADPQFQVNDGRSKDMKTTTTPAQVASRGVSKAGARATTFRRRSVPDTRERTSAKLAALPRLPDTSEEVKGIARALNANFEQSVFTGIQANEQTVKTMTLTDRRVIVFATHGLIPGDLDGLTQPALALTAPAIANIEGDGLLTMSEILNLKLNADWVILSACNTGAAEGAGAEAISGLGRAFFYAGARALLVSNWPVETTSATKLTTTLFEIQQGTSKPSRAESLRQTMLTLIDDGGYRNSAGDMIFSYAHPLFWAPFTLVGDGGQKHHIN